MTGREYYIARWGKDYKHVAIAAWEKLPECEKEIWRTIARQKARRSNYEN